MARGTVVGEQVVSRAGTEEFREGYERTFGDRKAQRGRWVWDEAQQKLVSVDEYQPPERAVDAPILSGRFYEGMKTVEGEDIGSRRKHQAYMAEHGLAPGSDYSPGWYENRRAEMKREADKKRRETVERVVYTKLKP